MSESNHIGWAIYKIEQGYLVRRREWAPGVCLEISPGRKPDWLTRPFILLWNGRGESEPWHCPQGDLLAKDWELAK